MKTSVKRFNVVITGPPIARQGMEKLAEFCDVECAKPYMAPDKLINLLSKFKPDALLVRMGKINKDVLGAVPTLKVIAKHGTGVDNIDLETATRLKIPVLITPNANFESVAEHAMGLMLALAKDIPRLDARMRKGYWDKSEHLGAELKNKTLGLVGFGRTGQRLRELVAPFEMKIVVHDPITQREQLAPDIEFAEDVTDLLRSSDIVSLHCPLSDNTRHLINRDNLRQLKKGAWIINTARGGIIDEEALVDGINSGRVGGAALDTFESEPPDMEKSTLFDSDRIILTPHVAGVTEESFARMGTRAVENIITILKGQPPDPECLINPDYLVK